MYFTRALKVSRRLLGAASPWAAAEPSRARSSSPPVSPAPPAGAHGGATLKCPVVQRLERPGSDHSAPPAAPGAAPPGEHKGSRPFLTANTPVGRMDSVGVLQWLGPFLLQELKDVSALDLVASVQALAAYDARRPTPGLPGTPVKLTHGLLHGAHHYSELALAIYGWQGVLFYHLTEASKHAPGGLPALTRDVARGDAGAFRRLAGLPPSAVLHVSEGSLVGLPKYALLADDAFRSVVLSIRGTMSFNDLLTDLVAEAVPFAGGYAHEGLAYAAVAIFDEMHEHIERALEARPGYGLVVTGHSLGAGVAQLVTIHTHHLRASGGGPGPFPGRDVHCWAYAPPPVFGPISALPPSAAAMITCLIHDDDVVSRLSLDSVRELLAVLRAVSAAHPSLLGRLRGVENLADVLRAFPGWAKEEGVSMEEGRPDLPGYTVVHSAEDRAALRQGAPVAGNAAEATLQSATAEAEQLQLRLAGAKRGEAPVPAPPSLPSPASPAPRFGIPGTIFCFTTPPGLTCTLPPELEEPSQPAVQGWLPEGWLPDWTSPFSWSPPSTRGGGAPPPQGAPSPLTVAASVGAPREGGQAVDVWEELHVPTTARPPPACPPAPAPLPPSPPPPVLLTRVPHDDVALRVLNPFRGHRVHVPDRYLTTLRALCHMADA